MKKVTTKWVIAVSANAKVKVKKGDKLKLGEIVAQEAVIREKVVSLNSVPDRDLAKFGELINGKEVSEGEVIYETGGIFGKKIRANFSGKVVKVDEFKNVYVQTADSESRQIKSPTEAVVEDVSDNKVVLKFQAEEFTGQGLNEGREWAESGLKTVERISDLTSGDGGKVIMVKETPPALLVKAEVIGVKGIVVLATEVGDKDDKINVKLPTLKIDKSEWELLLTRANKNTRVMINATSGRLLLII